MLLLSKEKEEKLAGQGDFMIKRVRSTAISVLKCTRTEIFGLARTELLLQILLGE
jgi:hypothetical protein